MAENLLALFTGPERYDDGEVSVHDWSVEACAGAFALAEYMTVVVRSKTQKPGSR